VPFTMPINFFSQTFHDDGSCVAGNAFGFRKTMNSYPTPRDRAPKLKIPKPESVVRSRGVDYLPKRAFQLRARLPRRELAERDRGMYPLPT
jgi:hypothetical protein